MVLHRHRIVTWFSGIVFGMSMLVGYNGALAQQAERETKSEIQVLADELRELQQRIRELQKKYMELYAQSQHAGSMYERQQILQKMQLMHVQLQRLYDAFAAKQQEYMRKLREQQDQQERRPSVPEEVLKEFRDLRKKLMQKAKEINQLAEKINRKIRRLRQAHSERMRRRLTEEIDRSIERLEAMKKEYRKMLARLQELMEQISQAEGVEIRSQ